MWADDAVALEIARPAVWANQLPFALRLRPAATAYFGAGGRDLPAAITEAPEGARRAELATIFVLERMGPGDGRPVELVPLRSHNAFTALLGNAYWFSLADEQRRRQMVSRYLDLSALVPIFRVRFRAEFECIDAILDALEQTLQGLENAL
jgi:hypothetical protein